MTFRKGQSGNPSGRPKRDDSVSEQIRAVLATKDEQGRIKRIALAEKLVAMAMDGNMDAMKVVLDRSDGKVPETKIISGDQDAPVRFTINIDRRGDGDDQA